VFVDTIEQKIYLTSSGSMKSSDSGSRQGEGPADKSFFFEQWYVTTKEKSLKQCLSEYPTTRMLDELEKGDVSGAVREKAGNWNAALVEDFWARKGTERILMAIASRVQAGLSHPLAQSLVFLGLERAKSTIDRILFTAVGTNLNEAKLVLECRSWLEQCQTSLDFNLIEKDLHWMILRAEEHEDWGTWLVASTLAKPKSMHNRPELSNLAQEERAEITRIFPQIPVSQEWGKEKDPASALARPAYLWNDDDLVDYLCEVDLEDADLTSAIRQHLGQRLSAIEPQFFAKAVRRHPELSSWLSNSAGESETDSAGSTVQKQTGKWGWFFGR
jgi:hypothetical protein